jgi:HEAT repeat protein
MTQSMVPQIRSSIPRTGWPRSLALGALLLAATLFCQERAAARPDQVDVVKDFRDALKADDLGSARTKEALDYRKANLEKKAEKLTSLGDIAQVLLLQEWRAYGGNPAQIQDIDKAVRNDLTTKFETGIKAVLASGDASGKTAAAILLRETAINARTLRSPAGFFVRNFLGKLAPELIRLIESKTTDDTVRLAAIAALGQIEPNPESAVATLEKQLQSTDPIVRRAAASALADLIQAATTAEKKVGSPDEAEQAKSQVLKTGAAVVAAAARWLKSPDVDVRRHCVDACRQVSTTVVELIRDPFPPSNFPPANRVLTDEDKRSIGRMRTDIVEPTRQRAAALLEPFQKIVPILAAVSVEDADVGMRIQARHVLEELATARQRLARLTASVPTIPGEPMPEARLDAEVPSTQVALPPTGPQAVIPVVPMPVDAPRALLVSVNRPVAYEQPKAAEDPLGESLRKTLDTVKKGLSDPDTRARLAAIDTLESLGDEAAPALPDLVRALSDKDRFVRWSAARTVGRLAPIQPSVAVPKLADLAADPDIDVRLAAFAALERYGPAAKDAVTHLGNAAIQGDPEARIAAMKALQAIGDAAAPALPAVATNLKDDNTRVRQITCETLGRFGSKASKAAPALRKALEDPESEVRRAASNALLKVLGK